MTAPPERPVPGRRLSEILAAIAADDSRTTITMREIMALMEGRARAALIFLFAFPNVLPMPPGMSGILGLPLLYLTSQMMLGRLPWLPRLIADRGIPMGAFASVIGRAMPHIARAERALRPRLGVVVSHGAERILGAFCLALAVILTLPVPLGNVLPALAICLMALGVLERDGVWALAGVATGVLSVFISAGVVYALFRALFYLLSQAI